MDPVNDLYYHYGKTRLELEAMNISRSSRQGVRYGLVIFGELKLANFTNLQNLKCSGHNITNLDLSECINLKSLDCQENKLTYLNISQLIYLEIIFCQNNVLTELKLGKNNQALASLHCTGNQLTSLNFNCLNSEVLGCLELGETKFCGNLEVLGQFTNLTYLNLKKNQFCRDLKSLQKLTKLSVLNITNNQINSGLEYLIDNNKLLIIACEPQNEIAKLMGQYYKKEYNFKEWRECQPTSKK
ncbi:23095_t:CDS:1 [Gigaspora margarita]|uniref:23095_t:CDS:1 n=1 Tax=Gigaspora margarita TaxID=4874 RepID=A0ABM8VVJ6_GIGMA|nr:23095_t:CDS:1 [Gigaspora margarita]